MSATSFTNGFSEKLSFQANGPFRAYSKEFLEILQNKRCQEVHGNYINGFFEKTPGWGKWAILDLKMVHPHNFGFALRIFLKFCTMKGPRGS